MQLLRDGKHACREQVWSTEELSSYNGETAPIESAAQPGYWEIADKTCREQVGMQRKPSNQVEATGKREIFCPPI